jgi:hypothetical protein
MTEVTVTLKLTEYQVADALRAAKLHDIQHKADTHESVFAQIGRQLPPDPIHVEQGDVIAHKSDNGWTIKVLSVFGDFAWCKHSTVSKPEEWPLVDLEKKLNSGIWVLV